MFDFEHWCSWVEGQCQQSPLEQVTMTFHRGQSSSKMGAAVAFETNRKLMQLAFWETGEADFYGIGLLDGGDIFGFNGRLLDDRSFEKTFQECLTAMV